MGVMVISVVTMVTDDAVLLLLLGCRVTVVVMATVTKVTI